MADPALQVDPAEDDAPAGDVEMVEGGAEETENGTALPDIALDATPRITFLDYLRSPIVEIVVGHGDESTILSAHQALLVKSPYFAERCNSFAPGAARRIELLDEDVVATGSVLEYLYNGEYFPRRVQPGVKNSALEEDPEIPENDEKGVALLRHARVYTLADRLQMPVLKSLAHSKIHRTRSTAKGEIAYARYVYRETNRDDLTIRKPVAAFWATRSHVLRHEAEAEFRAMCLEFPQFGFDVLSLVLDQREKQKAPAVHVEAASSSPQLHSGRKRARVSQG